MALEKATDYSERDKAVGNTPAQQEQRAYHEGDFQTHDPVTGEKRSERLPGLVDDAVTVNQADDDDEASPAKKTARKRR